MPTLRPITPLGSDATSFHDLGSERAIIASLILNEGLQEEVFKTLPGTSYFWDEDCRFAYQTALDLRQEGKHVDFFTLSQKGKKQRKFLTGMIDYGKENLLDMDLLLTKDTVLQALKTIRECWIKRQIYLQIQSGRGIDEVQQYFISASIDSRYFNAQELASYYFDLFYQDKMEGGIMFPWKLFNKATQGMKRSQYIIVAARPSVGKTSFLENTAWHSAYSQKKKTLFASAEMDTFSLTTRIMSRLTRIDLFRQKPKTEEEQARFAEATDKLSKSSLFFYEEGAMNTANIERQLKKEKFKLVCIDYLSLIEPVKRYRSLYEKVTFASGELKALAIKYKTVFLVASQYNRLAEGSQPTLANLRESGAVEQDADLVISLWRDREKETGGSVEKVFVDLLKNRNGWTFTNGKEKEYYLWFNKPRTEFAEPIFLEKDKS